MSKGFASAVTPLLCRREDIIKSDAHSLKVLVCTNRLLTGCVKGAALQALLCHPQVWLLFLLCNI